MNTVVPAILHEFEGLVFNMDVYFTLKEDTQDTQKSQKE